MYTVTLINIQTNRPHEVGGTPVVVPTDNPDFTSQQLLRNRDTKLFRVHIEKECEHDS
jgi:hypothetical protein